MEEGDPQGGEIEEGPDGRDTLSSRDCDSQYQNEVGASRHPRADTDLVKITRLSAARRLPPPEREERRHAEDGEDRIDGIEPRYGDREAADPKIHVPLDPDRDRVERLEIGDRLEYRDRQHRDHGHGAPPFYSRERPRFASLVCCSHRQVATSGEIDDEAAEHESRRATERNVPSVS